MVSINLTEVHNKNEIAKIVRASMENNGIKKSELVLGTNLSKNTINNVLNMSANESDYMFSSLLKVLEFLKIKIFIGRNEDIKNKVLPLF